MMFKGTSSRTAVDIAQSLESVGGHLNAFTGKEQTCYYAHILDEHLEIAVDVISDIVSDSIFEPIEMTKEKSVILEELRTIDETPEELIFDLFWRDVFDDPLGLSIIGNEKTINQIGRDDLLKYLAKNYTSNRIIIAASGNVEHETLVRLVRDRFSKITPHAATGHLFQSNIKKATKRIIEDGSLQSHICIGTPALPYRHREKFSLLVLNTLLGGGMSSRLFQNIREKHALAYSIYSFLDFLFDTGLLGVYIGTDLQNIEPALELINHELHHLSTLAVDKDELERTKSQLKGNIMLGLENTSSRMSRLAKMEIYLEDYYTLDSTLAEIEKVTSEDILAIAAKLLHQDNIFTTILKPQN
jgi:predicted Zn-dependent peptidase